MEKLKLRLSNCFNYATEFEAVSEQEFKKSIWVAFMTYQSESPIKNTPELQVKIGGSDWDWINVGYADNVWISVSCPTKTGGLWDKCVRSHKNGVFIDEQLKDLVKFITQPDLKIINGKKNGST